jgi:hypothetical protein
VLALGFVTLKGNGSETLRPLLVVMVLAKLGARVSLVIASFAGATRGGVGAGAGASSIAASTKASRRDWRVTAVTIDSLLESAFVTRLSIRPGVPNVERVSRGEGVAFVG